MGSKRKNKRLQGQIDKTTIKSLFKTIFIVVLACVVACSVVYGLWFLYQTKVDEGMFRPKNIIISGNVRASDEEIKDAADLEREGVTLTELDVRALRNSIVSLPWIKSVSVSIELPDTVHIDVTEHIPLGLVNQKQLVFVDNEGQVIKVWSSADDIIPPIVSTDRPIEEHPEIVTEAFAIAKMVSEYGYPHEIEEVHYEDAVGYVLYTDTTEIRLGYDRFEERIERLLDVEDLLESKKTVADYILIDAEDNLNKVIVKPHYEAPKPVEKAAESDEEEKEKTKKDQ